MNRSRGSGPSSEAVPGASYRGMLVGNPFAMVREVAEELERKFCGVRANNENATWTPQVECRRAKGALTVTAELPGMTAEDVSVEITSEGLILEGERKRQQAGPKDGVYRCERSYGRFYRFIPLPERVRTEEASAELIDGLLTITVPLPEVKEQRRAVPVKSGK